MFVKNVQGTRVWIHKTIVLNVYSASNSIRTLMAVLVNVFKIRLSWHLLKLMQLFEKLLWMSFLKWHFYDRKHDLWIELLRWNLNKQLVWFKFLLIFGNFICWLAIFSELGARNIITSLQNNRISSHRNNVFSNDWLRNKSERRCKHFNFFLSASIFEQKHYFCAIFFLKSTFLKSLIFNFSGKSEYFFNTFSFIWKIIWHYLIFTTWVIEKRFIIANHIFSSK